MIWQKKNPPPPHTHTQRGWGANKIFDSTSTKTAISVSKEPTLTKFQNNIDTTLRRKGGVKTEKYF